MSMGLITMTGAFKPQEILLIYENCRANVQSLLSLVWGKNSINTRVGLLDQLGQLNMRIYPKICGFLRLFGTAYIRFFPQQTIPDSPL